MHKSVRYALTIIILGALLGGVYVFWDSLPFLQDISLPQLGSSMGGSESGSSSPLVEEEFAVRIVSGTITAVDANSQSITIEKKGKKMKLSLNAETVFFDLRALQMPSGDIDTMPAPVVIPELKIGDLQVGNIIRANLQGDSFSSLQVVAVDITG